ncbi:Alpha/Beta hydrolase protein [Apodospora peruviana]|uniref:Alpha/Beta hydrolase protein n=1 Tax=Apodospora peruviana TaxID=516989 RepID=A0AAE0ICQ8_9PEZI|nr:Alpha/Beta hydrolase protein [Apodospora peruviana]
MDTRGITLFTTYSVILIGSLGVAVSNPSDSPLTPRQRTRGDGGPSEMELGPVSYLDCIVFCLLLAPQLVWRVGLLDTCFCVLQTLPFLLLRLPASFVYERYLVPQMSRSSSVWRASAFEDVVTRCVRYAFTHVPPRIGRVFFSKEVALPFLRFRLLRNGYLRPPIRWKVHRERHCKGIWMVQDPSEEPDFVLYYAHGGGFSLGTPYFYLEFLLTWLSILVEFGYCNPAIFALEYTVVPDASFPVQVEEAISGYKHVLEVARDPSIVCVSGDSAGAMLILNLLLHLGGKEANSLNQGLRIPKPALALLISPWVTLVSTRHVNTRSDYLDVEQLHQYGLQFAGERISANDPLISPGCCEDRSWWKRSSPSAGFVITYGEEEVFTRDIQEWLKVLREAGVIVSSNCEPGGIHAWPVASLFLSSNRRERLRGLGSMTEEIRKRVP